MNKKVSIIIVNYNGKKWIKKCFDSLHEQNYKNIEIIFVDNASIDGSVELIKRFYPEVKIIINKENLGFVGGNNIGYQNSTGDYILLLNNDTIVTKDFLEVLVAFLNKNKDVGVVQPKIYLTKEDGLLDCTGSFLNKTGFLQHVGFLEKDRGQYNKEKEIFSAKGACMLIKRELIEKINLFDDDYFAYFEETDFCWRSWLAGCKTIFLPQSIIYHDMGLTSRNLPSPFIDYHSFKNRICTLIKNLGIKNLIFILPLHLFLCVIISFLFFIKGRTKNGWAIIKAIKWNIINIRNNFQKRKYIQQKIRIINDKTIFNINNNQFSLKKNLKNLFLYLKRW
ncbi:MAG: glycosyltransferase family 2 protein [Patescibacteria group bacterium]|nr:glycosyltransferase family 2 protein [Patescibacteria group bacterium]